MLAAASSATSVDGGALLRLAWLVVIGAIGVMVHKEVDSVDLGRLRSWLREKIFQLLLIKSQPSPLAAKTAAALRSQLARLPGITAKKLRILDPQEHEHGLREVVFCALAILWGAYTEARTSDRTLQFGMWIRLVGVATVGLGAQLAIAGEARGLILMESALGLALLGVGHFLGALRWRRNLWVALLMLGPAAMGLDGRFAVAGSGGRMQQVVEAVRQLGSVTAALACVMVAVALRLRSTPEPPGTIPSAGGRTVKAFLIKWGMRSAGIACVCYSLANLSQAFMVAPTMFVQATHLTIAICLALAAMESRHPAASYDRLISSRSAAR